MEHTAALPVLEALAAAYGDLYLRARSSAVEALNRSGHLKTPADRNRFIEDYVKNYIDGTLAERARLKALFERSASLPVGHA